VIELLWLPFLACLVLTAIHVYLGLHVLARGVIFVDLALAQVAALGITIAFLAGHPVASPAAYWYALVFAVTGGLLFAVTRVRRAPIPQEAIIGIVYAVSAAMAVLVVDRAPQGSEHIKQLLVGSILTVDGADVGRLAALYALVGALHWAVRRPLLRLSFADDGAAAPWWDALFYATFAVVVTSSVRVAGVLLVFAFLVVPAAVGTLLTRSIMGRLAIGWSVGAVVSAAGLAASYLWDLPTGAAIVTAFGAAIALVAAALGTHGLARRARARGMGALRPLLMVVCAAIAIAGALLALVPQMDHHWLNWLETAVPAVERAFLTNTERAVHAESTAAVRSARVETRQLAKLQQDVQWGAQSMDAERRERLRQFLASRTEIAAGDTMVLRTLRSRARERQRYWIGVPLLALGALGAAVVRRGRPRALRAAPV
jgi:zinc/manganese transport system permease protein